jgi:hypothetical protein
MSDPFKPTTKFPRSPPAKGSAALSSIGEALVEPEERPTEEEIDHIVAGAARLSIGITTTSPSKSPAESSKDHRVNIMSIPQPTFGGTKGEDAGEYIEAVECYTDSYTGDERTRRLKVVFRCGLTGRAQSWYKGQPKTTRADWEMLKKEFETKFAADEEADFDQQFLLQQQIYNLRQEDKETDAQYLRRVEKLSEKCPASLASEVARRTLGGLKNVELQYRVQGHLFQAKKIDEEGQLVKDAKFKDVRSAFIAATRLIGKPNPLELEEEEQDEEQVVSQSQINFELYQLLRRSLESKEPPKTTAAPPPYRPPNPFPPTTPFQQQRSTFYTGTCYNCLGQGHIASTCPQTRVPESQYRENRQKVEASRTQRTGYNPSPPPVGQQAAVHMVAGEPAEVPKNWTSYQFNHPARQPDQQSLAESSKAAADRSPKEFAAAAVTMHYEQPIQRYSANAVPNAVQALIPAIPLPQAMPAIRSTRDQTAAGRTQPYARPPGENKGKGREDGRTPLPTAPSPTTAGPSKTRERPYVQPYVSQEVDLTNSRVEDLGDLEEVEDSQTIPDRQPQTYQHTPRPQSVQPPQIEKPANAKSGPKESIPIKLLDEAALARFDVGEFLCSLANCLIDRPRFEPSWQDTFKPKCRADVVVARTSMPWWSWVDHYHRSLMMGWLMYRRLNVFM